MVELAAFATLGLLSVIFLWHVAWLGHLPNSTDFILQYYPNLAFLAGGLRALDLPLWNPLLFAGTPYLADPQSQSLYFPNWPFLLLLDTADAARAIVVGHFALATAGMYLLLRHLRLGPVAGITGAVMYGAGPYAVQQVAWLPMLISLAWMPLALMLFDQALERRSLARAALTGAVLALQFFNGWPHGTYITAFALAGVLLWRVGAEAVRARVSGFGFRVSGANAGRGGATDGRPGTGRTHELHPESRRRSLAGLAVVSAVAGITAGGLAAPLILPFLEFWRLSNYAAERGAEATAAEGAVNVLALLGVGGSEGHGAYLGVLGLALALVGAFHGGHRVRWLYVTLAAFALLVAFGANTPLYGFLYGWVPGFRTFHMPGRFMALFTLAASVLAAMGVDALTRAGSAPHPPGPLPEGRGRREADSGDTPVDMPSGMPTPAGPQRCLPASRVLDPPQGPSTRRLLVSTLALGGVGAALGAVALAMMLGPDAPRLLLGNLLRPESGPYLNGEMARHVVWSGLVAAAFLATLATNRVPRNLVGLIAAVLVAADLFLFQGKDARYFSPPPRALSAPSPVATIERLAGGDRDYRVAGFAQNGASHYLSDFPFNLNPALVPPNLSLLYGVEDLQGYLPLRLKSYADYLAAVNGGPQDYHWALVNNFQSPLLDLLGLRYAMMRENEDRLRNVTIATNVDLGPGRPGAVRPSPIVATGLVVHSFLGDATEIEDGRVVGRLTVRDASGEAVSFDLRAGFETAEWAYDRPEVASVVRHRRAPVATTRNLPASTHVYAGLLSFPAPLTIADVEVEQTEPSVHLTVTELVAIPAEPVRRWEEVGEMDGARLFRNLRALPRALLVPGAEVVRTPEEALARLGAPDFDPRRTVVLEQASDAGSQVSGGGASEGVGEQGGEGVRVVARGNNRVGLAVSAASPGYLLLNELSYPGWNAYLDGRQVTVWRANYLFRAIQVPPGEHSVEFRFEPDSLRLGLATSALTLAFLLVVAVLRFRSVQGHFTTEATEGTETSRVAQCSPWFDFAR